MTGARTVHLLAIVVPFLAEHFQCDAMRKAEQDNHMGKSLDGTLQVAPTTAQTFYPVFDFDADGCYPDAAVSRLGKKNGGLRTTGKIWGGCRNDQWNADSNTYHRFASLSFEDEVYEAHVFELYFQKDQVTNRWDRLGHRHDIETVLMYFKDGQPQSVATSAHGKFSPKLWNEVPKDGDHPKIVYHKDGVRTHSLRFATNDEKAENNEGTFLMPSLASWFEMSGDGLTNSEMREKFNVFDFGSAAFKISDDRFFVVVNDNKPDGFPTFGS